MISAESAYTYLVFISMQNRNLFFNYKKLITTYSNFNSVNIQIKLYTEANEFKLKHLACLL